MTSETRGQLHLAQAAPELPSIEPGLTPRSIHWKPCIGHVDLKVADLLGAGVLLRCARI